LASLDFRDLGQIAISRTFSRRHHPCRVTRTCSSACTTRA